MKKFNKMTEVQMTKTNGGIAPIVLGLVGLSGVAIGGAGVAVGVADQTNGNSGK